MKRRTIVIIVGIIGLFLCGVYPLFAGGGQEKEATQINFQERPPRIFISPNGDGVQDVMNLSVKLDIAEDRVVKKYELTVFNNVGELIYEQSESKIGEGRGFFGDLFGIGEIPSVEIPDTLAWDGTNMNGNTVPDGDYLYQLTITDNEGNVARTPPLNVTVDTEAPEIISVEPEYTVFSPNDDGVRDVFEVEQRVAEDDATGAAQVQWTGTVTDNAGNTVYQETWKARPDSIFRWDGTNQEGDAVADGTYSYTLSGLDPAGNAAESAKVSNIILSTKEAELALFADKNAFSPNDDGSQDSITFNIRVRDEAGVEITKWTFLVRDDQDSVVRRKSGSGAVPETIEYDGTGSLRNPETTSGDVLDEGNYTAILTADFLNGNYAESAPVSFKIDLTPPSAFLEADPRYYGGETKPKVDITLTVSESGEWNAVLDTPEGEFRAPLEQFGFTGKKAELDWYGYDLEGNEAPDGTYTGYVYKTDEAGNYGESSHVSVIKDTRSTPIDIVVEEMYFSPDNDGVKDLIRIRPVLAVDDPEAIDEFLFYIVNDIGRVVRSRTIRQPFDYFDWDGRTNGNTPVPEGRYTVELEVIYKNGNRPEIDGAGPIIVDRTDPDVFVEPEYLTITPDGDGNRDTVYVEQTSSEEKLWTAALLDEDGDVVISKSWEGEAEDFVWDGRGPSGEVLPDGIYTYRISSQDLAGNVGSYTVPGIRIDTLSRELDVRPLAAGFSPNGDGYKDNIDIELSIGSPGRVGRWKASFGDTLYGVRHSIDGTGRPPETITWDGMARDGRIYDGEYYVQFTVEFADGVEAEKTAEKTFVLDASPPETRLSLFPLPLSPDGDGDNEDVTIAVDAEDRSEIESWNIDIISPEGELFKNFAGRGTPPEMMSWDGVGRDGNLVQSAEDYTVELTVSDELRNVAEVEQMLPIDLLVMRQGDTLKVMLPNIQFAPNTTDFFYFDEDLAEQNIETLQKLAKVLKRYGYEITVEGHAVKVFWAYPEKGRIEQEEVLIPLSVARAKEVKKALAVLGVDRDKINTTGLGGSEPLVPHGDLERRWINRRTEFNVPK